MPSWQLSCLARYMTNACLEKIMQQLSNSNSTFSPNQCFFTFKPTLTRGKIQYSALSIHNAKYLAFLEFYKQLSCNEQSNLVIVL